MPASDGLSDLLAGFFGARRQGKTTQVKAFLAKLKAPRLIIFDPMDEYGELGQRVTTLVELKARIVASGRRFALRYVPPIRTDVDMQGLVTRFEGFCSIAADVGDVLMVCDELHLVTRAGYAPPAWRRCLTLGGHHGVRIIAVSHRPAQVDKVFFSLANYISCHRLNFDDDATTMANVLGVPKAWIVALKPYERIVRNMVTGEHELPPGCALAAPLGHAPRARTAAASDAAGEKNISRPRARSGAALRAADTGRRRAGSARRR